MAKPVTRQLGTRQEFYWQKEHVYALVSRIREHSDGRITAEVSLKTDKPDAGKTHIIHTQLNLLSTRGKKDLIRELANRYPLSESQWTEMVEQLCNTTLENYRTGKPPKEIWPAPEDEPIPEPEMLVSPILYRNKPTLIYGEGSTGKSYLALTLAIMTQLPYTDNNLWLKPKQANALYLDYESDEAEFKRRLSLVTRGFGIGPVPILYRECELPLVEDIDHLEEIVLEYHISFIIIDSLGVATGNASLNDAATATAFYSALRRLKVSSLIITHVSKESENKKQTAYGSVYFTNLARSVFWAQKHQEQETSEIAIDLVHTKNNQGPLLAHQGFRIEFQPDRTLVSRIEPETVPEFLERMSLKQRVAAVLKEEGKLSIKDMAELLDKPDGTIRAVLNRYKSLFLKLDDGQWGLKYEDESHNNRQRNT